MAEFAFCFKSIPWQMDSWKVMKSLLYSSCIFVIAVRNSTTLKGYLSFTCLGNWKWKVWILFKVDSWSKHIYNNCQLHCEKFVVGILDLTVKLISLDYLNWYLFLCSLLFILKFKIIIKMMWLSKVKYLW